MNEIDNQPIKPAEGQKLIFSLGSFILLGMSLLMMFSARLLAKFNQEEELNCNVKLFVIEEGISEVVLLDSDAELLCREFYRTKDDYGDFLKPERRFMLYINDEEIVIDPFYDQYAYKDHKMLFSKAFNDTLNLYINFVNIKRAGVDFDYSGNLTFEERVKIYTYFYDGKYKTTSANIKFDYKQYVKIDDEYYYFDGNNNYMVHDDTIVVDDEIMFLIKKAIEGEENGK